jgi:hypothetical protein
MILRSAVIVAALAVALGVAAGCTQKKETDVSSSAAPPAAGSSTSAAPAAAAPAAPATATPPAAAPAAAPATPAPAPASAAPAPDGTVADTTAKLAAVAWAIRQDEIKNDPDGQWATDATASSSYNDATGDAGWSAKQATGAPNVDHYSDDGHAWAPKTPDGGIEWLDLKYARPVHASEVRVRESAGSGAVVKVELFDEAGAAHTIWQGNDETKELNYLILKFKPTDYKVNRVKVTLATNTVPGWNEIDAVQLVGKP